MRIDYGFLGLGDEGAVVTGAWLGVTANGDKGFFLE